MKKSKGIEALLRTYEALGITVRECETLEEVLNVPEGYTSVALIGKQTVVIRPDTTLEELQEILRQQQLDVRPDGKQPE
ncbi:hypothetical protein [Calidithermus timidus]|jgi:hypothetical protein|uniref:hypothetical protein n=1 Tax=Calidithermus timidus TaxID=307124 RepID=UPI000372562D|nr:hypothetical protein [Calidithermus timidus]